MKISKDFTVIECESAFKGKYTIPLWEEVWGTQKLKSQLSLIGSRAFERGYRQEAMSDDERTFPSYEKIFRPDMDHSWVAKHWPRVTGVDPFGQQVVIFTIAIVEGRLTRIPVEIIRGKFDPKRTITELIDAWKRNRSQLIVCENNAAQNAIIQWAQEVAGPTLPIIPFTTGAQKADPQLGLPSVEVEFANGAWCVPMQGIDITDGENPYNVWKDELAAHPIGTNSDTVMAMWFAREGARFLTLQVPENTANQHTATQEEVMEEMGEEFEEVKIGDY
jgi:hypothetical protein